MQALSSSSVFSGPALGRGKAGAYLEQQDTVSNKMAMGFLPALLVPNP